MQKSVLYNLNLDVINVYMYTKFGKILSIHSQDIERKRNSNMCITFVLNEILTSIKGHNSVANLQKSVLYTLNIDVINVNVYTKFGKFCSFIL